MIKRYQVKGLTCYIVLILILSVVQGKAQSGNKGGLSYGVKAGLNVGALTYNYIGLPDMALGFQFGGFGAYSVNSDLSVELELLYAKMGSSVIDPAKLYVSGTTGANNIVKSSVMLNTLEIPVLAKFSFDLSGTKSYLLIGPEMSIVLSATAVNTRYELTGETKSKTDVTASFQGSDFAGVIGFGINLDKINVDIRYRSGLVPINYLRAQSYSDYCLNALSLSVGYSF
jgi:hypothetical protein